MIVSSHRLRDRRERYCEEKPRQKKLAPQSRQRSRWGYQPNLNAPGLPTFALNPHIVHSVELGRTFDS